MVGNTSFLKRLSDKTVVVLGGTSGIGFAVASGAVEYGARVVISGSSQERLDKSLARIKEAYPDGEVSGKTCDLGDASKLDVNLAQLFEWVGKPIDHIVLTAGDALAIKPIAELTIEGLNKMQTVRYMAAAMIGKLAAKYMPNADSSSITFTGGTASHKPIPGWGAVGSIATSVEGLTRGLAVDLAPIRVNCILPGAILTEFFDRIPDEQKDTVLENFSNDTLVKRVGQPDEVAEAYLYTMKDRFCTGSSIISDGGRMVK